MIRSVAVGAITVVLMVLGAAPAVSDPTPPDTVQQRVEDVLARYPGGIQISSTTSSWEDGAILLTFPSPSGRAIGSCATGSYCAFSSTAYSGTRLAFTGCSATTTSNSVAVLGSATRSVANARTSGTVRAMDGIAVVHTLSANTGVTSNAASLTALSCTS